MHAYTSIHKHAHTHKHPPPLIDTMHIHTPVSYLHHARAHTHTYTHTHTHTHTMHTHTPPAGPFELTSFALALLLVFRTDSSYGRWNEAMEIWTEGARLVVVCCQSVM